MNDRFPFTQFGPCEICGGNGADYASPGSGNAPARDTTGNGVELENYNYKGRIVKVCNVCKNRLIADEESLVSAQKHVEEEKFRVQAGFKHSI